MAKSAVGVSTDNLDYIKHFIVTGGMCRYYALPLCVHDTVRMLKALDGDTVLSESSFAWQFGATYTLQLEVRGNGIRVWINDQHLFGVEDDQRSSVTWR